MTVLNFAPKNINEADDSSGSLSTAIQIAGIKSVLQRTQDALNKFESNSILLKRDCNPAYELAVSQRYLAKDSEYSAANADWLEFRLAKLQDKKLRILRNPFYIFRRSLQREVEEVNRGIDSIQFELDKQTLGAHVFARMTNRYLSFKEQLEFCEDQLESECANKEEAAESA